MSRQIKTRDRSGRTAERKRRIREARQQANDPHFLECTEALRDADMKPAQVYASRRWTDTESEQMRMILYRLRNKGWNISGLARAFHRSEEVIEAHLERACREVDRARENPIYRLRASGQFTPVIITALERIVDAYSIYQAAVQSPVTRLVSGSGLSDFDAEAAKVRWLDIRAKILAGAGHQGLKDCERLAVNQPYRDSQNLINAAHAINTRAAA